jgi:hypothetical protein
MANDRLYIRCTRCGDYLCLAKFYPSTGPYFPSHWPKEPLHTFIQSHLENCQPHSSGFDGPICLVFDSEQTLCDAGGLIGGSGNIHLDAKTPPR